MSAVAIIGAGDVGGALAHALARAAVVREIRLVDEAQDVAAGKALDLQHAAAVEGFDTRLAAAGELDAARGALVTVLADPAAPSGAPPAPEDRLARLRRLAALDTATVFVAALAGDRWLVERGVRELGLARTRLVGSAPAATEAAVRALVALALDCSPQEISLVVSGVPPERSVVLWSSATVRGALVEDAVAPAALAAIRRRLDRLPPPGPLALALAAAHMTAAIVSGGHRHHTGFVVLDGELGVRGRAAALPLRLGPGGVRDLAVPTLSTRERVAFDSAVR
jgi:malate dehydrogenase